MKLFSFILLLLIPFIGVTQGFDEELEQIAERIANQLDQKGNSKVAVWNFINTDKQETRLGKYFAEDFSVYLTKDYHQFQVMDRYHLDQFLNEYQLPADGYIAPETAKKLGKFHSVDYIVTGTVVVLNNKIKLRVKVLDSETASQLIADMTHLPIDENIASFLGTPGLGGSNRGFNGAPLDSQVSTNNPETVIQDCASKNTGDYCFQNNTSTTLIIELKYDLGGGFLGTEKKITIAPGQTSCIYDQKAGVKTFQAKYVSGRNGPATVYKTHSQGDIKIETCKSYTYTIGRSLSRIQVTPPQAEEAIGASESSTPQNNIMIGSTNNIPQLKPVQVYRSQLKRRPAGADVNDFYDAVDANRRGSKNDFEDAVVAGTELLSFLNKERSKSTGVIRDYTLSSTKSAKGIEITTGYYSQVSNSVHLYIKTNKSVDKELFRVSILNKKDDEVASTTGKITQNKGEGDYYQFVFPYTFELPKKATIFIE